MSILGQVIARKTSLVMLFAVIVTSAGAASKVKLDDYEGAVRPGELFIVDCLLPPQVRQLGQRFTYLAPRRPTKVSAKDCALRGGEYVAYDRASYATALKVWLPAAKSGEAEAQTYVGEIYENGLGVAPDYELAAQWYQKAAEQGHARAMINLGNLHERGRGVARDMTRALNLYRAASGLTEGTLELTTEDEILRRRTQVAEAEKLRQQVLDLTQRLAVAERTTERRRDDLRRVKDELAEALEQLAIETMQQSDLDASERAALARLRQENEQLRVRLGQAENDRQSLRGQVEQARAVSATAEQQMQQLKAELAESERVLSSESAEAMEATLESERAVMIARQKALQQEIEAAQTRLSEAELQEQQLRARVAEQERQMKQIQASLNQAEQQLLQTQRTLAVSGDALDTVASLELEIGEREAEIAQYETNMQQLLEQLGVDNVSSQSLASTAASIDMISPEVAVVRGVRSVNLFSDVDDYELIGRVTPRDQLIAFKVNDRSALDAIDASGVFRVNIPLMEANATPVSIEAIRADGSKTSERFVINKDTQQVVATRSTSSRFRNRMRSDLGQFYALVIGNNEYASHDRLSTAVNDAEMVAAVLQERYGYEVSLLTNASHQEMVVALAAHTQAMSENDNLLIYYAGHGLLDEQGKGYWLPVDAGAKQDETWIGNAQVSDLLGATQAKHVLVVADSCYSGTLSGAAIRPIPLDIDDQDLLFISRVKARTVLTSGGLQPVLDEGGDGHSIFGRAFIKAIQENTDLMEGYRLFDMLNGEVSRRSRLARVQQDPEYSALQFSGHEGSEFFFLPNRKLSALSRAAIRL